MTYFGYGELGLACATRSYDLQLLQRQLGPMLVFVRVRSMGRFLRGSEENARCLAMVAEEEEADLAGISVEVHQLEG